MSRFWSWAMSRTKLTIIFVSVCKCLIMRSVSSTSDFICSKKLDNFARLIFPYIPVVPFDCDLEVADCRGFAGESAPPVVTGLDDTTRLLG